MADKSEMKKLLLTPVLGNNPIALQVLVSVPRWPLPAR